MMHNQLPFEKLFKTTCVTCGQIVLYSTRLWTYQFRTWTFSIGIFREIARLFRCTVFDATPGEAAVFKGAIKAVVEEGENELLKAPLDSIDNKDDYPRRRIEIPPPTTGVSEWCHILLATQ